MTRFAVNGIGIVNGVSTGPPVLFLHGVGLDLTWWGDQFAALADHDVLAVDMPGHGLAEPIEGEPTFVRLTDVPE